MVAVRRHGSTRSQAGRPPAPGALGAAVEDFARKTISDGLSTDDAGNVYVTDPEHSAIHRIAPDGALRTLVRDPRLRWPDGLSFGPGGWLYVSCSDLHQVLFVAGDDVGWSDVRGAAMAAVARQPHLAVEVVNLEVQRLGLPPMRVSGVPSR